MRWTRLCRLTGGADADGEVVWSWRPLAGVKLATMLCIAPMTVTKTSWTPGRARRKPLKPSRRECRNDPTEPVVTMLVCSLLPHTRLRAQVGARHSLRPPLKGDLQQSSGMAMPRDRGVM